MCCVARTLLRALHVLISLNPRTPFGNYYYCSYFADENTEAKECLLFNLTKQIHELDLACVHFTRLSSHPSPFAVGDLIPLGSSLNAWLFLTPSLSITANSRPYSSLFNVSP